MFIIKCMSRDEKSHPAKREQSPLCPTLFVSRIGSQVVHSVDSLFINALNLLYLVCPRLSMYRSCSWPGVRSVGSASGWQEPLGRSAVNALCSCSIRGRSSTEECSAVHLKTVSQMCCEEIHLREMKSFTRVSAFKVKKNQFSLFLLFISMTLIDWGWK